MKIEDMPKLYQPAKVVDIDDPEDMGRVKVEYLENGVSLPIWLAVIDSFYSSGNQGWNGVLGKGDKVRVSFIDWPMCQNPVIDGKFKTKNTSQKREEKEFIQIKDHAIEFSENSFTIKHKSGTEVNVTQDSFEFTATSLFNDIEFGGVKLVDFISKITCVGNLGLVAPLNPTQSTALQLAIASSKTVKIGV